MSKTIWKYPVDVADTFTLMVPRGAEELCVQMQGDEPYLWLLVSPLAELIERTYHVYGTGNPLPDAPGSYVGTFQVYRAFPFVWHLFAEASQENGNA